jgi:hypothetical protein
MDGDLSQVAGSTARLADLNLSELSRWILNIADRIKIFR